MRPSDLVTHYGEWIQPERCQTKGPQPKPRWMPLPKLLYAQHEAGLRQQLALFQAHHNFGLPHASLCLPLPEVEMITEPSLTKRWRQQTLAMAAGLTDHIWSLTEVLMYRVPPWWQSQMA